MITENVKIVDMKDEVKYGNFILSKELKNKIEEKLEKKEQIILLLNRRGYSSSNFSVPIPNSLILVLEQLGHFDTFLIL